MTTAADAPRKYHKVCFYTASATTAIQLDFLCAVIICIIYRPKTHHNIINHITSLPVNITCVCMCVWSARVCVEWHRPKAFSVRRGGKSRSENDFFSRKNRERLTIYDTTQESGDVILDIICPPSYMYLFIMYR